MQSAHTRNTERDGLARKQWGLAQTKQKGAHAACCLSRTHVGVQGVPVQAERLRHQAQTGLGYPDPDPEDEAFSNMNP